MNFLFFYCNLTFMIVLRLPVQSLGASTAAAYSVFHPDECWISTISR